MPNRIIKESSRTSETLDSLSDTAERLFWRLVTVADDYGRFEADPRIILANCFPLRVGVLKPAQVEKWFEELQKVDAVKCYIVNNKRYAVFTSWENHQRKRAEHSKFPEPPLNTPPPSSDDNGGHLTADDSNGAQVLSYSRVEYESSKREARVENSPAGAGSAAEPPIIKPQTEWPSPESLVDLYNEQTPDECPAVSVLSPGRREKAKKYLHMFPERQFWENSFKQMHRSQFLRGQKKLNGARASPFLADFDWLLQKGEDGTENVVKVHDGKYHD